MTSQYRGVSWHKRIGKWQAAIWNGFRTKKMCLGYYTDEIEAAKAYDVAAKKFQGDYAILNFPPAEAA